MTEPKTFTGPGAVVEYLKPRLDRVWRYNNSDYTYQSAANLAELRALPWVAEAVDDPGFYRLSIGTARVRAPWDRSIGLPVLMAEYNDGAVWHVLGGLEMPELYDLPKWEPKQ